MAFFLSVWLDFEMRVAPVGKPFPRAEVCWEAPSLSRRRGYTASAMLMQV